jgi:hypothetical protein
MGYTHYWTIFQEEIPDYMWQNFAKDILRIYPQIKDVLDQTTDQKFDITGNHIIFNGIGEEGHETFSINTKNKMEESHTGRIEYFDFCKTARKEYDIAVCCALIIAKKYFADIIRVASDGSEEDGWDNAKRLCQKVLKYGKSFDIERGEFL